MLIFFLLIGTNAKTEEWYYPPSLSKAKYTPVFTVKDTSNKYGRYADKTKTITIKDLILFHGHFCGGLVETAAMYSLAFNELFPDGIIDRTDIEIVSNNSACGGDVAEYLSGARHRYKSHYIDYSLGGDAVIVQRVSSGKTVKVMIKKEAFPKDVRELMLKIESGKYTPEDIDEFGKIQWEFAEKILSKPLIESFNVKIIESYNFPDQSKVKLGSRKDNDYKNAK
jgi:formylmethanofuran dehydrogenase subunit E